MKHSILIETTATSLEALHKCVMGDYECDPISREAKWWMLYGIATVVCKLFNSLHEVELGVDDMYEFLSSLESPSNEGEIDEMFNLILEELQ